MARRPPPLWPAAVLLVAAVGALSAWSMHNVITDKPARPPTKVLGETLTRPGPDVISSTSPSVTTATTVITTATTTTATTPPALHTPTRTTAGETDTR